MFWESHLDQTYLGMGDDAPQSTTAMDQQNQLPATAPGGDPMPSQALPVFLGLTKGQLLTLLVVAFAVYWIGSGGTPAPRRKKSKKRRR